MNQERILIVEDDIFDQMAYKRFFELNHPEVQYLMCSTVREAQLYIINKDFDVIIADMKLSDGTVFDLFHTALKLNIPVIVVTGEGDEEYSVQAIKAGAADYLIKDREGNYLKLIPITVEKSMIQKRSHLSLKENEERIRSLQEASFESLIIHQDGKIIDVNGITESIFGYSLDELRSCSIQLLVADEDKQTLIQKIKTGEYRLSEFTGLKKDGTRFFVESIGRSFTYLGRTARVEAFRDIDQRKKTQAELNRLNLVASRTVNSVIILNASNHFEWGNDAFEKLSGKPISQWQGSPADAIFGFSNQNDSELITLLSEKKVFSYEHELISVNGTKKWILSQATPVFSKNGEIEQTIIIQTDLTEKKAYEDAQVKLQNRFRVLFNTIKVGMLFVDETNIVRHFNEELKNDFLEFSEQTNGELEMTIQTALSLISRNFINQIEAEKKFLEISLNNADSESEEFECPDGRVFEIQAYAIKHEDNIRGQLWRFEDITRRKLQQIELIRAREQAEQIANLKNSFISNMSHEIRTPMNAVLGMTYLLDETKLDETQKEYINSIKFSAEHLTHLISDILDFSKIESGKFRVEKSLFNLKNLISEITKLNSYKLKAKKITFVLNVDEQIPELIEGDPSRLSQVLMNLLGNANKFTEKGTISLDVSIKAETVKEITLEFAISDTGIGIPENKLKTIFETFTQASNEITRKYGGTGLGLAISKQLVELMGGDLKVESQIENGSRFFFTLQFKKESDQKNQSSSTGIIENNSLISEKPREKPLLGRKILVAEDQITNQLLVKRLLENWGAQATIMSNGRDAYEEVINSDYEVVIMDIQMPEMDGYQACSLIRTLSNPEKSNIPIIALTASAAKFEIDKCYESGMNAYISKPFFPNDLLSRISTVLEESKKKKELLKQKSNGISQTESLLDLSYLETFVSPGDNMTQFISEMLKLFLSETPLDMLALNQAVDNAEYKPIKDTAHKLKSTLTMLGIKSGIDLVKNIELDAMNRVNILEIRTKTNQLNRIMTNAIGEAEQKLFAFRSTLTSS